MKTRKQLRLIECNDKLVECEYLARVSRNVCEAAEASKCHLYGRWVCVDYFCESQDTQNTCL